ncbi:MAG: hypothetical protein AMJ53_13125, partial [Gammaproteobacteria bacterium SG8_11]
MRLRWLTKVLVLIAGCGVCLSCEADGIPRFAYSVNSFNNSISQFIIDRDAGRLIPNGLAPSKQFPSAIAVHPSNRFVFATAQASNELQVYYLDQVSGRLTQVSSSPIQTNLASSFAITFDPSGRHVYVAGRISNNIMGFEFNPETAELTPINGMPVATQRRARQFVVHPSGKYLYSVNVYSDTVSAFRIHESSGALSEMPGSPYSVGNAPVDIRAPMDDIPEGITQAPYNITAHPSGDYVFVTNWMSASVTVFKVNQADGKLTLVEGSPFRSEPHPYDAIVSPDGRYLYSAHWASNTLVGFEINTKTGKLKRIKADAIATLGQAPVDLVFQATDNILCVANYYTHNIASFRYDPETGLLSLNSSTPTRFGPRSLSVAYGDK